jgi:hypothetical protein
MKRAVDTIYKLLWLKQNDPEKYDAMIDLGNRCGMSRKRTLARSYVAFTGRLEP